MSSSMPFFNTFQNLLENTANSPGTSLLQLTLGLVLAYLGGVISSFTPCIYPMIPITVGFIGGHSEKNWKTGLTLSIFYVLGMAFVYSWLGVFAALSGRIFGTLTNTQGWYIFLGVVLTLSSLWMLDVLKFDPNVMVEKLRRKFIGGRAGRVTLKEKEENSWLSAFTLGASSGFLAAPCTTPVLTVILTFIATNHSIVRGTLLMFAFALGLGTILVIVGTFAGALKLMPRSGKWLSLIKTASALLILFMGQYYIFRAGGIS